MDSPKKQPVLRTVCLTRSGQEQYLLEEIKNRPQSFKLSSAHSNLIAAQVIEIVHNAHEDLTALPLFFAAQTLPDPQAIEAQSISNWANSIVQALIERFGDAPPNWCLHIFEPKAVETGKQYARQLRIQEGVIELLKQRRRSYLRSLLPQCTAEATLVQVLTVSATQGFISFSDGSLRDLYGAAISPNLAGYTEVADDKRPPSRAFKKLREALEVFRLEVRRGERAVDLGACPGGWTYVLRELGAQVTAIDRSPLAPQFNRDRGIEFIAGNALTWRPATAVDWMVCDVITPPTNTAAILKGWITAKLCANFCVTVKFKGAPDIKTLLDIAAFLKLNTAWCDARQLTHNKNELTIVGRI
jgi:23S rRNA (cytidine2498-2'-O)-methyltransferase